MTNDNFSQYEKLKTQKKKYQELLHSEENNLHKLEKALRGLIEFESEITNRSDEIIYDLKKNLSSISSAKFVNKVYSEVNSRVKGDHFFEIVSNVSDEKRLIKKRIIDSEDLIAKYKRNINNLNLKIKEIK